MIYLNTTEGELLAHLFREEGWVAVTLRKDPAHAAALAALGISASYLKHLLRSLAKIGCVATDGDGRWLASISPNDPRVSIAPKHRRHILDKPRRPNRPASERPKPKRPLIPYAGKERF